MSQKIRQEFCQKIRQNWFYFKGYIFCFLGHLVGWYVFKLYARETNLTKKAQCGGELGNWMNGSPKEDGQKRVVKFVMKSRSTSPKFVKEIHQKNSSENTVGILYMVLFQGLHFLFSGSLSWLICFWVICLWNKFDKKAQCGGELGNWMNGSPKESGQKKAVKFVTKSRSTSPKRVGIHWKEKNILTIS